MQGDTVWERPSLPAPPEGWSVAAQEDGDESHHVWTNIETGEEKKEHPLGELVIEKKSRGLKKLVSHLNMKMPKKTKEEEHPRGWSSAESDEGHTYYHNDHTGDTVWERPSLPAPPQGWEVESNDDGVVYYTDSETGEAQWMHPHGELEVAKKKKVLRPKKLAAKMFKKRKKKLPKGWTESVAEDGSPMFTNVATGLVQPERPKKTKKKKKKRTGSIFKRKKKKLPAGWSESTAEDGSPLFTNDSTGITTSQDPRPRKKERKKRRTRLSLFRRKGQLVQGEGNGLATLHEGDEEEEDWSDSSSSEESSSDDSDDSSSSDESSSDSD